MARSPLAGSRHGRRIRRSETDPIGKITEKVHPHLETMAVAVVLWGYTTDRTDGVAWVQRVQDNPALAGLAENLVTVGAVMTLLAITWLTQHVA